MKRVLLLLVTVISVFSLLACSGGIKGDDAKVHINGFFDAIENKDYELAATFLHPERPADLKAYFENLENEEGLNFSNIEIDKYTGSSSENYDSSVGGATYSLCMDVHLNDGSVEIDIEIVKNDNGYGIYNLDIDT